LADISRVLAEMVEGNLQPFAHELAGDPHRVIDGLARDEPSNHRPADRRGADRALDQVRS
jgi:hypothetical protein